MQCRNVSESCNWLHKTFEWLSVNTTRMYFFIFKNVYLIRYKTNVQTIYGFLLCTDADKPRQDSVVYNQGISKLVISWSSSSIFSVGFLVEKSHGFTKWQRYFLPLSEVKKTGAPLGPIQQWYDTIYLMTPNKLTLLYTCLWVPGF